MGEYTEEFEDESLYSKENLSKLKSDFKILSEIDGKDSKTFNDWALQIDRRSGVFDLKIDNKKMEEDDYDIDITTLGHARREKVAEKRKEFFLLLYKPLNNPNDFNDVKINLDIRLNEARSKQNWENFSKDDDILNYRKLLCKTAEKEREILAKFFKTSKKSTRIRSQDAEEYTPNDAQNELNFFTDISNKFAPDDSIPILKKSDYITFEFLNELKDICSGNNHDKEDYMDQIRTKYSGSGQTLNNNEYNLNKFNDINKYQNNFNNKYNKEENSKKETKIKYYFPELEKFLSVNQKDLIDITDRYKAQISKLGGSDKKVEETQESSDDDYGDKPKQKSSVNDLKLQLERINVAALNFLITFAVSDLKNTYSDNYFEIESAKKIESTKKNDTQNEELKKNDLKSLDSAPDSACIFLSTFISKAQSQLAIHYKKMSALEGNQNVNLFHELEKYDLIPSIINECFPTDKLGEINDLTEDKILNLKEEFYDDPKEILNKISSNKTIDYNSPIEKFLYSEPGLSFILNVYSKFNKKMEEKNEISNKRISDIEKNLKEGNSQKQNSPADKLGTRDDIFLNIKTYHSDEKEILQYQSEYYKKIISSIINHFVNELNLCYKNAQKQIEELSEAISKIEKNFEKNSNLIKDIIDNFQLLKSETESEIGDKSKVKEGLKKIGKLSEWNNESKEILETNLKNFFKKRKNIEEKIRKIDQEIENNKDYIKSTEEIEQETEGLNKEIEVSKTETKEEGRTLYLKKFAQNNYRNQYGSYNNYSGYQNNNRNRKNYYKNNNRNYNNSYGFQYQK